MSFGQQSGPPASAKQVAYLLSLLQKAGYDDFRDARRGLGLTQRQGGGKFTTREASALIDQLLGEDGDDEPGDRGLGRDLGNDRGRVEPTAAGAPTAAEREEARNDATVRSLPAGVLAGELERRGWTCSPPPPRR